VKVLFQVPFLDPYRLTFQVPFRAVFRDLVEVSYLVPVLALVLALVQTPFRGLTAVAAAVERLAVHCILTRSSCSRCWEQTPMEQV